MRGWWFETKPLGVIPIINPVGSAGPLGLIDTTSNASVAEVRAGLGTESPSFVWDELGGSAIWPIAIPHVTSATTQNCANISLLTL